MPRMRAGYTREASSLTPQAHLRQPTGLTGPFVTATATDPDGNTSEFSAPQRVWRRIYLPIILKRQ